MSRLGDNLKNAAAYEVAKVATDRKITLADDDIDALAARITSLVLEELASRELQGREVASRDETTNTWAEHSVRIDEYAEAARDLRFGVSGEDRSEPTPAPREPRVWPKGCDLPEPQDDLLVRDDNGDLWEPLGFVLARSWRRKALGAMGRAVPWAAVNRKFTLTEILPEVVTPEGTS